MILELELPELERTVAAYRDPRIPPPSDVVVKKLQHWADRRTENYWQRTECSGYVEQPDLGSRSEKSAGTVAELAFVALSTAIASPTNDAYSYIKKTIKKDIILMADIILEDNGVRVTQGYLQVDDRISLIGGDNTQPAAIYLANPTGQNQVHIDGSGIIGADNNQGKRTVNIDGNTGLVTANDVVVGGLLSLQMLSDRLNREELTRGSSETRLENRVSNLESRADNVNRGVVPILNVVPMLPFPGTIPGVPTPGVPLYQPQEGLRISPNEIEFGMFKFDESGNVANFTPKTAFLKSLQQLQQDVAAIKTHLRL